MAPLKPQESARGKPLDPALSTPAKTVLHALRKGVRAVSYCGFRFGLLLAAAAALRWGPEGVGLRRHRFFARKSGEKTRKGQAPCPPNCRCFISFQQLYVSVYLLNDLVCFSFRSVAAAVLVRAAALRRGEGRVAVCRATKGPCVPLI